MWRSFFLLRSRFVSKAWLGYCGVWLSALLSLGCEQIVGGFPEDPHERDAVVSRVHAPSCEGLSPTCGPNQDESCCKAPKLPGGPFTLFNDSSRPGRVSQFGLDAYEVSVGRFRKFVEAYPGSKPAAGAGYHARIANSGWRSIWNDYLPKDREALEDVIRSQCRPPLTWTINPGSNENKPITCISWFVAFAFCAWDGGRLPTEAERSFVAVAGSEGRVYPWSEPPTSVQIDKNYASYACPDCDVDANPTVVGSKPAGDGKWGHADLAGNVWEWTFDEPNAPAAFCRDCAWFPEADPSHRTSHGGGWYSDAEQLQVDKSWHNYVVELEEFDLDVGFRCAQNL